MLNSTKQMNTNHITKKFSAYSYQLSEKKLTANSYKLIALKNLQPKTYHLQPTRGFTLVEMLVSISVFLVVMLVAASSLLSIIDGNQKSQSLKSAINNLNFALESMQKNIRVGTNYSGGSNCSPLPNDTCIIFDSYKDLNGDGNMNNDTVIYKYNSADQSVERCENAPSIICNLNSAFIRLTAPEVHIEYLYFDYSSGGMPPRVFIIVSGSAGTKDRIKTKFNLQTTVSQRAF